MICATMVNTQTDRFWPVILSAHPGELISEYTHHKALMFLYVQMKHIVNKVNNLYWRTARTDIGCQCISSLHCDLICPVQTLSSLLYRVHTSSFITYKALYCTEWLTALGWWMQLYCLPSHSQRGMPVIVRQWSCCTGNMILLIKLTLDGCIE